MCQLPRISTINLFDESLAFLLAGGLGTRFGLMLAKPVFLDLIPQTLPADLSFHALPLAVGRMAAYRLQDFLIGVGTLETYQTVRQMWPGLSQTHERGD
jgi:hypothetical protein